MSDLHTKLHSKFHTKPLNPFTAGHLHFCLHLVLSTADIDTVRRNVIQQDSVNSRGKSVFSSLKRAIEGKKAVSNWNGPCASIFVIQRTHCQPAGLFRDDLPCTFLFGPRSTCLFGVIIIITVRRRNPSP